MLLTGCKGLLLRAMEKAVFLSISQMFHQDSRALKRELHIMMYEKRSMTFLEDETDMDVAWSMWEKGLMRIMEECIPPRYKH